MVNVLKLSFRLYEGFLDFAFVQARKVKRTLANFKVWKTLIKFVFFLVF